MAQHKTANTTGHRSPATTRPGYTWGDLNTDIQLLKREAARLEIAGKKARTAAEKLLWDTERKAAACGLEFIKMRHQQLKTGKK